MASFELFILDYNYSSWSMRAGVLLRFAGVEFKETRLHLDTAGRAQLQQISPSGLLPMLIHDGLRVWDSLAIAEYLAEQFPELGIWPRDPAARAHARSASAEMHSGFATMRMTMGMNIRAHYPGFPRTPEADRNVRRVQALWQELREHHGQGGPYLCGAFGAVDAMFAPVLMRLRTYDVKLTGICADYAAALEAHPAVQGWLAKAREDTFRIPDYDLIVDSPA
ncbi:MAG: glutathione S-transferase family protein [Myxococcales bacterium]